MKNIFSKNTVVLFQGDSITDCGRDRADPKGLGQGYPAKIAALYDLLFPDHGVSFINRGVSGDRAADLVRRYQDDFASIKPDLVSILIGINDTWRRYDSANDPTTAAAFEQNYRSVLQNLKRDFPAARIVIIEPFLLNTDSAKLVWREDLDPKIEAVRRLAREYADVFIPMDGILTRYAAEGIPDAELTADGVHPTSAGHGVIAEEWLKALEIL
ncbi:lipase [Spirochaetia bacterium]|nr:lipase [Spirochaetia bacterium]